MKNEIALLLSQYKTLEDFVLTELKEEIEDIANHGCSGGFPFLTYYSDTAEIYAHYKDGIWSILQDMADNLGDGNVLTSIAGFNGAANVGCVQTFENLLVWAAVEQIAYLEMGRRENKD